MRLCPYRKRIVYESGHNSGAGYPTEWTGTEYFEECIGTACAMYLTDNGWEQCNCGRGNYWKVDNEGNN